MTDKEIFKRFINTYGHKFPEFNAGSDYWGNITKGYLWYREHVPSGDYAELMEHYFRAVMEIATIEEMIKRGDL